MGSLELSCGRIALATLSTCLSLLSKANISVANWEPSLATFVSRTVNADP